MVSRFSIELMRKSNALKATGTVMPGRQYRSGQDQGGFRWIFANDILHLGKNLLQIQTPICEMQKQE